MKMTYNTPIIALAILVGALSSCKKYLDIPQPTNSVTTATAFNSRGTIDAMMTSLYAKFFITASSPNLILLSEYIGDDAYNPTTGFTSNVTNNTTPATPNQFIPWSNAYQTVYTANTLLGGLPGAKAPGFSDADKAAYTAAVKTLRAYIYFCLVRCYGDVPLVITTNVDSSKLGPRENKDAVYALIEKDLQDAMAGLPAARGDRYYIRSKFIPEAILADVYLTEGKWAQAEAAASDIINSNQYELSAIQNVFLQSSREGIMLTGYNVINPNSTKAATNSGSILPDGSNVISLENSFPALSPDLLNSFEPGDLRKTNWVKLSNQGGYSNPGNRMFCYKYKYNFYYYSGTIPAGQEEDNKTIRLAEMYLIRAEARARQNNLTGAAADLNVIRTRAGLPNTTAATQTDMIEAVLRERRVELFFEQGHRWFDLVRTGKANAVLSAIPYKAANWKPYMVLFPIAPNELAANPNLTQTPGY